MKIELEHLRGKVINSFVNSKNNKKMEKIDLNAFLLRINCRCVMWNSIESAYATPALFDEVPFICLNNE